MADPISFNNKGKTSQIDLNKIKDGITKAEIAGNDKRLGSIFDKVDKNRNQVLEQNELQEFYEELSNLAGNDNELTDKEAKGFKNADGKKMKGKNRKAFYEFLNKLSEYQQDPAAVQEQAAQVAQEQAAPEIIPTEIPEQVEETVISQAADEIVPDATTEDSSDVDEPKVPTEVVEEQVEPEDKEPEQEITSGIIVQNGESPAAIAKKFNVPLQDLLDANEGKLKGKGKNKYFLVGAEIVIPRKIEAEELAELTQNRKSTEETLSDYVRVMAAKEQKRAQQQAEMQSLGIVNRKGAGTVVSTKTKATEDGKFKNFSKNPASYKKMTYTVVGETGNRGRMIVKASNGKYYTMAKDGVILQESYATATKALDSGKAASRGDKHGRKVVNVDGKQYVFAQDGTLLNNNYVTASDTRDAGGAKATRTGGQDVTYVKDAKGKVWYFDEKTGNALVKDQHTAMVNQEADQVAQDLLDGANYTWGTNENKIEQGLNNIYSPEIMARVNKKLAATDSTYAGDKMTKPVEALLLDEFSHTETRQYVKNLAANGAYGSGDAMDAALGRNAAREIKYEVHGGLGITTTKDLKNAMSLVSTRGARLQAEKYFETGEVKGQQNEGSWIRQYIAEDGYNAQAVDQFDATWIKNGAYDHEHDQEHRNTVTDRLVFEYGNDESLQAGLEAIDTDTADYQYISARAAEENKTKGYQAHFNGQEALQTYIAGRATQDDGTVETPKVSAYNTLLYKGEKPVRIQAEEALYDAKAGNFSTMFDSMDPKVYEEMADMLADGEVSGCKNIKEAYKKALNSATTGNDKTTLKANAIISGQIEFSDAEIADFCVELMHNIDSNKGAGASTGVSAKHTNTAEYMTEQLKAILQENPQVIATVREQVENGIFESTSSTIRGGGSFGGGSTTITTKNNKDKYLAIINDSKHVADEAVFYDKDGNKITNPEEIAALTNANMQALQGMRDYVAQLERDFKKGVDAEGGLSNMANGLLTYSGIGTDRDDVANKYRNAKLMLAQLEAAAQGKLRDSEGNVISAQDLAQKIVETQDSLAQTNSSYQSSMQTAKMGIVLAPVIVATTVATAGTGAGFWTSAAIAGVATAGTEYSLNTIERVTSITGDTAEAREEHALSALIDGASTFIGVGQMKFIPKILNNAGTFVRGGGRLITVAASDIGVGAAGEYVQTGTVTINGVAMNAVFSVTGNLIGIKSLSEKHIKSNAPNVDINNNLTGRDPIADGEVARNIDQQHLNANERRMIEEGLADVPTPEELAAYQRENGYQAPTAEERAALNAHQEQVAQAHAEAHELGNMVNAESLEALERARGNIEAGQTTPPSVTPASQQAIDQLTGEIRGIDGQIRDLNRRIAGAKRFGKDTSKLESQLSNLEAKRAAKAAELETMQRPAAEPESVVLADDAEPVVRPDDAEPVASADDLEFRVQFGDKEIVIKPESIAREAQAIPEASIPAEHRSLWKSCQERLESITAELSSFKGNIQTLQAKCKSLLADMETVAANVTAGIRTRIEKLMTNLKSLMAAKNISANIEPYKIPDSFKFAGEENGVKIYRTEAWNDLYQEIHVRDINGKPQKVLEKSVDGERVTNYTSYDYDPQGRLRQALMRDESNVILKNEIIDSDGVSIIYDCENGYVYADIQNPVKGQDYRIAYELPLDKLKMATAGENPGITAKNIAELANLPQGNIKYGTFQRVTTEEEADAVFRDFVQNKSKRITVDNSNERYCVVESEECNAEFEMMDGWAKHYHKGNKQGTDWKIHIYADSPTEWANVAQLSMPYLDSHKIDYKTISNFNDITALATDTQRGKAFTVYFKNEEEFLQAAKDLEAIFSKSGMKSSGVVANDAQIGDSGFLSYRNECSSRYGSYKPADLEDPYLNMITREKAAAPEVTPQTAQHILTSEEKIQMSQLGNEITRANTLEDLAKAQQILDNMPECPQKTALKNQLDAKLKEIKQTVPTPDTAANAPETVNAGAEPIDIDADVEVIAVGEATPHEALVFDLSDRLHCSGDFAEQLAVQIEARPEIAAQLSELALSSGRYPYEVKELINMATPDNIATLTKLSRNRSLKFEYDAQTGKLMRNDFEIVMKIADSAPQFKAEILDVAANSQRSNTDIYQIKELMNAYPDNAKDIALLTKSNPNIKVGYDINNNLSNQVDRILMYMDSNPQFEKEILDYMSVQRKALNDTSDPVNELQIHIQTLKRYPQYKEAATQLAKNPNLDAIAVRSFILDYGNNPSRLNDIIKLSGKKYTEGDINRAMANFERYPELRAIILSDAPSYKLIDTNVGQTSYEIIQKRFEVRNRVEQAAGSDLQTLQRTLGDEFYFKVKWEDIIPENASDAEIRSIISQLNDESKFFARTSVNERNYGKNIQWAHEINNISEAAALRIGNGENFEQVIHNIAADYRAYDVATTLDSNTQTNARREYSGRYRGKDQPQNHPYGASTPFTKNGGYSEYYDRFMAQLNKQRTSPYEDVLLTNLGDCDRGTCMLHPVNQTVEPAMKHIGQRYNELQPLLNKVRNGGKLTPAELKLADEKISEMYFLMGNVMPWARGSNGISDIFMRSTYKALGVEQPALRKGVSLDLEAFCMDLNEYKAKWNSFFEDGRTQH